MFHVIDFRVVSDLMYVISYVFTHMPCDAQVLYLRELCALVDFLNMSV